MIEKRVQVLLSTYNGERYLRPLLESLLSQEYRNIEILIRDDGSSDGTVRLLEEYALRCKKVKLIKGENLGVIRSFFELLRLSSPDVDYLAFCDQDDVWEKDKINRAVDFLNLLPEELPLMYCSRVFITDEQLNVAGISRIPRRGPSFGNALVENIAPGCTMVINKVARDLILLETPNFENIRMHDWWIYLVISAFGKVFYDEKPTVLYRQHAANVVGIKIGLAAQWQARFRRFRKYGRLHLLTEQAKEFRRIYGHLLSEEKKRVLDRFLNDRMSFTSRMKYALTCEVYRQSLIDDLILRALILLNRV